MNTADFTTASQGFPLTSDSTLGFMQSAYTQGFSGLAAWLGLTDRVVIVSGVKETTYGSNVYSDGFVIWDGELLPFTGGNGHSLVSRNETVQQRANQNGVMYNRYFTRSCRFGAGATEVNFSSVLHLNSYTLLHDAFVHSLRYGSNENLILRGGEYSGGNINAGLALLGNSLVSFAAYEEAVFPAYLTQDGWFTSLPSAPYIEFDPQCSQYYNDFVRRKTAMSGEVRILPSLSDRFDGTGLGKWEMLGWAVCNGQNGTMDLRGKTLFGVDAANGFPVAGTGGAKEVVLTIDNMPSHNHSVGDTISGAVQPGSYGLIRKSAVGDVKTIDSAVDSQDSGVQPDLMATPMGIPSQGAYEPFSILNPYRVIVFVQRI